MLTLHYAPNTISVAVALALKELDQEFVAVKVDFASAEQTQPSYLALNPKGRVPTLVVDQQTLTETGALLDYLADVFGRLRPADQLETARMREVMFYLASTMHVNHAHKMRGSRWADTPAAHQDMTSKVPQTMAASAEHLEQTLAFAPFAVGQDISLADVYLYVVLCWLEGDKVDILRTPKLAAYFDMMSQRASVVWAREAGYLS